MKRIITVGVVSIIASLSLSASQQTFTGEISDSMCGASHAGMGDRGKNSKECTAGCVKGGAKYVFVSKGKVRHSKPGFRHTRRQRRRQGSTCRRRGEGWKDHLGNENRTCIEVIRLICVVDEGAVLG